MNVLQLISQVQSGKNVLSDFSLSVLHAKDYPLSLFSWLVGQYKRKFGQNIQSFLNDNRLNDNVIARMHVPFLTGPSYYWLQHIEQLDKKKRTVLLQRLSHYTGPHYILMHTALPAESAQLSKNKAANIITIPETVTRSHLNQLSTIFGIDTTVKDVISRMLFARKPRITFDALFFLVQCARVIPADQIDVYLSSCGSDTLIPSNSLFGLSTAFFQRRPDEFYRLWGRISSLFPEQFWISYFSDQVWRAYHVIMGYKAGKSNEPYFKQISRRLPFSFIEKDWCTFTPEVMQQAHHFLYDIDFQIKNGGSSASLESFFLIFFS